MDSSSGSAQQVGGLGNDGAEGEFDQADVDWNPKILTFDKIKKPWKDHFLDSTGNTERHLPLKV